jgi:hypothetical protein
MIRLRNPKPEADGLSIARNVSVERAEDYELRTINVDSKVEARNDGLNDQKPPKTT